jgi:hypothetical protein
MVLEIDTAAKRARLPVRKNPYWRGIAGGRGGVSLGYRRTGRRGGAWIAKIAVDGQRAEERVGLADDANASSDAISYRAAVALTLAWSEQQYAALEARRTAGVTGRGPTVRLGVEAYIKMRIARANTGGLNAAGQLKRYVLSDAEFSAVRLSKLRADTIEAWRERLPIRDDSIVASTVLAAPTAGRGISASTVNRLLNDLRAALYVQWVSLKGIDGAPSFRHGSLSQHRLSSGKWSARPSTSSPQSPSPRQRATHSTWPLDILSTRYTTPRVESR